MSQTTVCFVHDDALDLFRGHNGARFGGAETQVYLLAKLIADQSGFAARIVGHRAASDLAHEGVTFRTTEPAVQRGLPLVPRSTNRRRAEAPYRDLGEAVIVQTIAGEGTVQTQQLAKQMGLKFVYRMSCDADIDGRLLTADGAGRYVAALKAADGVIAQSAYQQAQLEAVHGIHATVIPNIVECPLERPAPGGTNVLWVGRAAPIKRPWLLIEAARRLPELEFVMVMPKEDPVFWMSITQEMARVPNVHLVPGVSYFEMDRYYRDAAMLVSTSAIEGFPNVFLQSAAQATPVVSLDVDPGGMLEGDGCGRYAAGNVDLFQNLIRDYMADPKAIEEMGTRAFRYVRERHSPEAVAPLLTQFLSDVVAR